jgi:hypothetical protein
MKREFRQTQRFTTDFRIELYMLQF